MMLFKCPSCPGCKTEQVAVNRDLSDEDINNLRQLNEEETRYEVTKATVDHFATMWKNNYSLSPEKIGMVKSDIMSLYTHMLNLMTSGELLEQAKMEVHPYDFIHVAQKVLTIFNVRLN